MASPPEKAHTAKLPRRKAGPFLRFAFPDWSKLDVFGQTIILKELTDSLGSFQKACIALKVLPNEAGCFVETYLEQRQAYDLGRTIAQQWGRDLAVLSSDDDDIPQQRTVLILASSIAPACSFLDFMGHKAYVPSVQTWVNRIVTWPPKIDVTDLTTLHLNPSDYDFSLPQTLPDPLDSVDSRKQSALTEYECALENDHQPILGLLGRSQPRDDGTPDLHLSFIHVPKGSLAYGPHGMRLLDCPGRYYMFQPADKLVNEAYQYFLLAVKKNNGVHWNANTDMLTYHPKHRGSASNNSNIKKLSSSEIPDGLLRDMAVDHKAIFDRRLLSPPTEFEYGDKIRVGNHTGDEPQEPEREIAYQELSQLWKDWPGLIFQFRLPPKYTIIGPRGDSLTFDPCQYHTYDETGKPHGTGGTYHILPPQQHAGEVYIKLAELPSKVAFRLRIPEKAVILRNDLVLPRFVKPGVHEWSTREGCLDFYSTDRCYQVFRPGAKSDNLQNTISNSTGKRATMMPRNNGRRSGFDPNSNRGAAFEAGTMKCTKTRRQDVGSEFDKSLGYTPAHGALPSSTQTMDHHRQFDEDIANTVSVQLETSNKTVQGVRSVRASATPRRARRNYDDSDEEYKPRNARGSRKARARNPVTPQD
jgi:hypothetical protein